MLFKHLSFLLLLPFALAAVSQKQSITGRVTTGPENIPLYGAVVTLLKNKANILTDSAGHFSLGIQSLPDTLIITHIGYHTLGVPVISYSPIRITLQKSSSELDEVIVSTGYQMLPKERSTGSFSQIDNKMFNELTGHTIMSRLEGQVSGLFVFKGRGAPQGSTGISIRGLSGISEEVGAQDPLIVVDNFVYEGDITNINPNDVYSITMLKDAAAASIWGARAGNGVIVITTKKSGYNQPFRLSINSAISIREKPDLFYVPQMPTSEYIDLEQFLFDKGYYNAALNAQATPSVIISPVVYLLAMQRDLQITEAESTALLNKLRERDLRNEYNKYFYRNNIHQQYALNLTGGSVNLNYLFSAGYDKDITNLVGNESNRITLRNQTAFRPYKNLELSTAIIYTQSDIKRNSSGASLMAGPYGRRLWPYALLADSNGRALPIPKDYSVDYTDTVGRGDLLDWKYRPLDELRFADNTTRQQDLLMNVGIKYTLSPYLNMEARYQYQLITSTDANLYLPSTYYMRNLINSFTPPGGVAKINSAVPYGSYLLNGHTSQQAHQARVQLNFQRTIRRHQLTAIAGAEIRSAIVQSDVSNAYGYNASNLTYGNVDYILPQSLYRGGTDYIANQAIYDEKVNRFLSVYTNIAYTWRERYTLSGSARRDASNLFGATTNNKWTPLWSSGLSWNISKEPFYHAAWLPYLKLRATYGYQGNVNTSVAGLLTLKYNSSNSSLTNLPYNDVSNVPNPSLRWEKIGQANIAVDFISKNNRLSGTVEMYQKNCTDLLAMVPIDATAGVGPSTTLNSAKLRTKGLDITVQSKWLNRTIQWNTTVLVSANASTVVKYYYVPVLNPGYGQFLNPIEGWSPYMIITYPYAGLDPATGDPLGYLDKQVSNDYKGILNHTNSQEDLIFNGSSRPTYTGTIRNTISWKRINLSFGILYSGRYFFRRNNVINYGTLISSGDLGGYADYRNRWLQPGDEMHTQVPSMVYPSNTNRDAFYTASSATIEKGDHIRLQYVNLVFKAIQKNSSRLPVNNLEFYLNAANLGIIWKATKQQIDPDTGGAPSPINISFGIRAGL